MSKLEAESATFREHMHLFVDPDHPKKVYKVVKALYGLHQAPRAWYATLSTFLEKHGYRRGTIDKTLFIKKDKKDIMLVQVYVDDIIFVSTRKSVVMNLSIAEGRFQMNSMGELTFFLIASQAKDRWNFFLLFLRQFSDYYPNFTSKCCEENLNSNSCWARQTLTGNPQLVVVNFLEAD
ncbi:putative ribonuclease H-like domain-containing protein [Tanacetum coccineum]